MAITAGSIVVDEGRLSDLCDRWKVAELSLFGSALRADFRVDSDLDFLVKFAEDAPWDSLQVADMQAELETWFGRSVDLVELETVKNPVRLVQLLDRAPSQLPCAYWMS